MNPSWQILVEVASVTALDLITLCGVKLLETRIRRRDRAQR